ncbi:ATP-binding domain-containing protein, partial [Amnibacterium endophyticum]
PRRAAPPNAVRADRADDGVGSLAVVAPPALVGPLREALAAALPEPVGLGARGLAGGVSVLDPWTAKGLEFDVVAVVDPDAVADGSGAGALYVALTRPTRRLLVVAPQHPAPASGR